MLDPNKSKHELREQIKVDVEEFLARGGEIQLIEAQSNPERPLTAQGNSQAMRRLALANWITARRRSVFKGLKRVKRRLSEDFRTSGPQ